MFPGGLEIPSPTPTLLRVEILAEKNPCVVLDSENGYSLDSKKNASWIRDIFTPAIRDAAELTLILAERLEEQRAVENPSKRGYIFQQGEKCLKNIFKLSCTRTKGRNI